MNMIAVWLSQALHRHPLARPLAAHRVILDRAEDCCTDSIGFEDRSLMDLLQVFPERGRRRFLI